MMSYLATIVTDHHLTYLKMRARGIDEQLLKTSGAEVLSPRKKIRKNLKGGGQPSSPPPTPLVRLRVKTQYVEVAVTQIIRVCNEMF